MTTHTYLGRCDVPDISNLPNREERRKFRTGVYTHTIVEEVSRIDTGGGTEKNKARAKGTDTVHADALFAGRHLYPADRVPANRRVRPRLEPTPRRCLVQQP